MPIRTSDETNGIKLAYETATQRPAQHRFDSANLAQDSITEIIPGVAWVIPNLLTIAECNACIEEAEAFGLSEPQASVTLRTAKRTKYWQNSALSEKCLAALPASFVQTLESIAPRTAVRCLHPNWRVVKYQSGECFPAHIDGGDNMDAHSSGTGGRLQSSHTVLIQLSDRNSCVGGATRFWLGGGFDQAIDVEPPQGYAVVFKQKGLLHNGQLLHSGVKYAAQAGLMRELPAEGKVERPSIFRWYDGNQDPAPLLSV